jgi:hypothetical protein
MGESHSEALMKVASQDFLFHECHSYLLVVEVMSFLKESDCARPFRQILQVLTMKAFRSLRSNPP